MQTAKKIEFIFSTITVVSADSRALFAPANRDTASKAPRCIRHWRRIGAFHAREKKYFSACKRASAVSALQQAVKLLKNKVF